MTPLFKGGDQLFLSEYFASCPICGMDCRMEEENDRFNLILEKRVSAQSFFCLNPLAGDPLHYYSHIVDKAEPRVLSAHKFSVDLGGKYVLFINNYQKQKSFIKTNNDAQPLESPTLLMPDFPKLESLKKKIRTIITFT